MKYIVTKIDDKEVIIAFPKEIFHSEMSRALHHIKFEDKDDCRKWDRKLLGHEPISAGFITPAGVCHGRSESLDLDSRPGVDDMLWRSQ